MDFFKYALYALQWVDTQQLWVSLLVGGICFALVFIFQGIGLYVIAAREGIRHKWMAFVPFANTYFIGVLAKKTGCLARSIHKNLRLPQPYWNACFSAGFFSITSRNLNLLTPVACLK